MILRGLIVGLSMLAATAAAVAMRPTNLWSETRDRTPLEQLIPKSFGDWSMDSTIVPIKVSPEVQAELDKVYDQTLSRTYVNSGGQRVMVSIAYGGTQSTALQVHRPEVCYTAQGFRISRMSKAEIDGPDLSLPVMHVVAEQGARVEPITYWIRMGDSVVRGNLEQGFARLKYGLEGQVPDGLLFRVSTIGSADSEAFDIQARFVKDMLAALSADGKAQLIGR